MNYIVCDTTNMNHITLTFFVLEHVDVLLMNDDTPMAHPLTATGSHNLL